MHLSSPTSVILFSRWIYIYAKRSPPGRRVSYEISSSSRCYWPDSCLSHTLHVEGMWQKAKRQNKRQNGTRRELLNLDSYLCEFMWSKSLVTEIPLTLFLFTLLNFGFNFKSKLSWVWGGGRSTPVASYVERGREIEPFLDGYRMW